MAFATACIVTDLVDTAELLGNPAFVVPAGRIVELANRASDVINSAPDERHTLEEKALTGVKKHYCIGSIAEAFRDTYDDLQERGRDRV